MPCVCCFRCLAAGNAANFSALRALLIVEQISAACGIVPPKDSGRRARACAAAAHGREGASSLADELYKMLKAGKPAQCTSLGRRAIFALMDQVSAQEIATAFKLEYGGAPVTPVQTRFDLDELSGSDDE